MKGRRDADLALLVAADHDPYVRWDAVQELGLRALLKVRCPMESVFGRWQPGTVGYCASA